MGLPLALTKEVQMTWPKRAAVTICAIVAFAVVAAADQWNDRTTFKFDAPMMIPGATLPPGTYTFKLLDSKANRHVVQIFDEGGTKLVATAQAVPTKRMDAKGDVVVKLNPTEAGAPVAIKAWFYPGSLYGHEFVYPDRQARDIAQRTKTLVLSTDVEGSDMEKGTLYTYSAEGRKEAWHGDDRMMREWEQWSREGRRAASARVAAPGTPETRESTAPMMRNQPEGMKVSIGDLEDSADKYVGKTVNVTAEVEEVFGPRLFKIDEPNWGDLDGEVLVYLPSELAALVREDDRVTITGTPRMFVKADIERELGWLEPDPDVEIEFSERPVLVASRIVGGNSNVALAIRIQPTPGNDDDRERATGTSGTAAGTTADSAAATTTDSKSAAVTDAGALGRGDRELVGRRVNLDGVKVTRRGSQQGFWVDGGGASVFVLPSQPAQGQDAPSSGQSVSVHGVVLEMPRSIREKARATDGANDRIYVYAMTVR